MAIFWFFNPLALFWDVRGSLLFDSGAAGWREDGQGRQEHKLETAFISYVSLFEVQWHVGISTENF